VRFAPGWAASDQAPIAVPRQRTGFGEQLVGNVLGRGFARYFFQRLVQVVGVHGQLPGKLVRIAER